MLDINRDIKFVNKHKEKLRDRVHVPSHSFSFILVYEILGLVNLYALHFFATKGNTILQKSDKKIRKLIPSSN